MILTTGSVKTERFTPEVAERLKTCDKMNTFCEGGWFFAYGSKDGTMLVKTHADSRADYERLMNPGSAWEGKRGTVS